MPCVLLVQGAEGEGGREGREEESSRAEGSSSQPGAGETQDDGCCSPAFGRARPRLVVT